MAFFSIVIINLSNAGVYPLLTYISSVNDINSSNDTLAEDIRNYDHDFYTADYSMSFEPFEDVTGWHMEDVNTSCKRSLCMTPDHKKNTNSFCKIYE